MTIKSKLISIIIAFAALAALSFFAFEVKTLPDKKTVTWRVDDIVVIFSIVFAFGVSMLVMVAGWTIPKANPKRTKNIAACLSGIMFDVMLLICSSLFQIGFISIASPSRLSQAIVDGFTLSVLLMVFFVIQDAFALRGIRSQVSFEMARKFEVERMKENRKDFDEKSKLYENHREPETVFPTIAR